jgi:hypothetical protein
VRVATTVQHIEIRFVVAELGPLALELRRAEVQRLPCCRDH